jgi:hypothetical protein
MSTEREKLTPKPESLPATPALVTIARAARFFPSFKTEGATHVSTLTRWILRGLPDGKGGRVKLRAVRLPGGWATTQEWIERFLEALTDCRTEPAGAAPRTPNQRRKAAERAGRELDQLGL